MTSFDDAAYKVAEFLLQIKAVKLQPESPFTWASGLKSPIYCDNRKTLSYPKIRTYIRQHFVETINEHFAKPDVIAGVATGGIAIGALVAQEMGLPFIYVRSEAKKHGLTNMIEGEVESGQSVVVIEDLISTGGSSLKAVEALREGWRRVGSGRVPQLRRRGGRVALSPRSLRGALRDHGRRRARGDLAGLARGLPDAGRRGRQGVRGGPP